MIRELTDLKLEQDGIRLRKFTTKDITTEFVSWLNDPQVMQYSNQRFITHTYESCFEYLQSFTGTDNLYLAIEGADSRRLYGSITAYRQTHHGTADIGIMIGNRQVWGKGYGHKAWSQLMTYLIEQCRVRKVTGGTLSCNLAMRRIMEKSGMSLEAIRAEQEIIEGLAVDMLYFCKFSEENINDSYESNSLE
jgi:ribosomal-protein-alanine N-acetyltransferase